MRIVLFEDNQCDNLRPIGMFRPLYDLRIGSLTLREIVEPLGAPVSALRREHFILNGAVPDGLPIGDGPMLFLNASVEPDIGYVETLRRVLSAGDPFLTTSGNRVAAALVPDGKTPGGDVSSQTIGARLLDFGLPLEDEMFRTIDWPHEAVAAHLRTFPRNLANVIAAGGYIEREKDVFVGKDVDIARTASFETGAGPVVIDSGVTVMHFTYLSGPIRIGAGTRIIEHSSIKDVTAVGAGCKVGGEVEASIIEPHSNKQHHGFLGHSWVGQWVNLGAGTSTSDLKNTYGTVRVYYRGARVETGMQFLGSIIGDFAKSAVNTSLFTGKIVGASSMLYGTVTTNVPCFSNYARSIGQVTELGLDQALTTQKRMFARRNVEQTPADMELMRRVFEMTKDERVMSEEQINF
jgi:UDP-N-acetylglucosamine diphosphorylase / glucose-1-phosphate thymidylyltransferase / UDP-N-acetylgalactosamine diphosphorylase / glucosamine-1-phosphate N-acetyltransferase / galactosamine-1-phosphate N-acetyltransferase